MIRQWQEVDGRIAVYDDVSNIIQYTDTSGVNVEPPRPPNADELVRIAQLFPKVQPDDRAAYRDAKREVSSALGAVRQLIADNPDPTRAVIRQALDAQDAAFDKVRGLGDVDNALTFDCLLLLSKVLVLDSRLGRRTDKNLDDNTDALLARGQEITQLRADFTGHTH